MEISNSFRVPASPDATWNILNDVERIAPCLPGAQLLSVDGDEYRGLVKVKLGPVTTQYQGVATFVERDEAARRAVLSARGRESRGQGNANATITAALHPDGDGTRVDILTDLTITGKAAQFGRGMFSEVSQKLLNQFAQQLEALMSQEQTAPEPAAAPTAQTGTDDLRLVEGVEETAPVAPVPSAQPMRPVEAFDLTGAAGAAIAKRAGVAAAVLALVILLLGGRRARRSRRRSR